MKRLKTGVLLLLAAALCLIFAACGGREDTAGADWRTNGTVVGSGVVHRGGESVNVLVTIGQSGAAFYLDQPEQELFESVSFPESIPDAQQSFCGVAFDDINGDGESDVTVSFLTESGDSAKLTWVWDPAEGYVFREERGEN